MNDDKTMKMQYQGPVKYIMKTGHVNDNIDISIAKSILKQQTQKQIEAMKIVMFFGEFHLNWIII